MSTTEITWQEPPADPRMNTNYGAFFDALRERPGEWAVLPGGPHAISIVSHIKAGRYSGSKPGEFDATGRSTESNRRGDVYVRYVDGSAA